MSEVRYRRSPDALSRRVGDRVLLTRAGADAFEVLDGPGATIWETLATPTTVAEIVAALASSFEAPSDVIERDVEALVGALAERGMVVEGPHA